MPLLITKLQFRVHMKVKIENTKKSAKAKTPASNALFTQVTAKEKNVEKAWVAYQEKDAAFELALKEHADKTILKGLLASAKIARLTYKIEKIKHKLAKATWKASAKAEKKPGPATKKDTVKIKSEKPEPKVSKDSAISSQ